MLALVPLITELGSNFHCSFNDILKTETFWARAEIYSLIHRRHFKNETLLMTSLYLEGFLMTSLYPRDHLFLYVSPNVSPSTLLKISHGFPVYTVLVDTDLVYLIPSQL